MLLMASATFCIGLLPTYSQIGALAPILLIFLRLLQGLSFAAELPGAATVVYESSEKQKKAYYSSFVISSASLGSILASFVIYLLSSSASQEQIHSWAWRIPFLFGGLLAFANYFIRKYLHETPDFKQLQAERPRSDLKAPLKELFQSNKLQMLFGMGMNGVPAAMIIFSLYLPSYLGQYCAFSAPDIFLSMTLGMMWSACVLPVCGRLSDYLGKINVFVGVCALFFCGALHLFHLLTIGNLGVLIAFMLIYQTVIGLLMASYFPILLASFLTETRLTGVGVCYNVTYAIMGLAPVAITSLIELTGSSSAGIWFLMGCAVVSGLSCLGLMIVEERRKNNSGEMKRNVYSVT